MQKMDIFSLTNNLNKKMNKNSYFNRDYSFLFICNVLSLYYIKI